MYLLGCGTVAGACGQTAAYPFDLIRRRFQIKMLTTDTADQSILKTFRQIIHKDGISGLYRGLVPNFIKVVPSIAVMFTANELMKRMLL